MMIRMIIQTGGMFMGGFLSTKGYSIKLIYTIQLFSPLCLLLYTLLVFKETKKPKSLNGCREVCKPLKNFCQILLNPGLIFPLVYSVMLVIIPNFVDVCTYILLNKGGWTLVEISYCDLSTGIIFALSMMWFLEKLAAKIKAHYNFLIAGSLKVVLALMNFYCLQPQEHGFTKMFAMYWC